jgi:hypothetical protein
MGNSTSTSPQSSRVENVLSIILTLLLFCAVIIYAGFRGYHAYHHLPATQSNFMPMAQVPYPAVTFCPESLPLLHNSCIIERSGITVGKCDSTMTIIHHVVEGINQTCFKYNSLGTVMSTGDHDELAVKISLDTSKGWGTIEPIVGALLFIHDPNVVPELQQESTFMVDAGHVTTVFLSANYLTYMNGTKEVDWIATHSAASVADPTMNTTFDVDFMIIAAGVNNVTQYYVYTVDQWIGEVGGFASLMLFLHRTVLWIIMFFVNRSYPAVEQL